MIAKGEFLAEVLGASLTTSQNKGTEQVVVEFRFLDGPNEGSMLSDYQALTDAALPYTVAKLRTCGWKGDDLSDLSGISGNKVQLVIKHEDYDGKTRARVQFVNPAREKKRLGGDEAAGIASKWRNKIAALDAAAGRAPAASPPPTDDIPF